MIPAFFKASMVGFHFALSQATYSSKCPYSTYMESICVTGPLEYWGSSLAAGLASAARASNEARDAARHSDAIAVLSIFSSCCDLPQRAGAFRKTRHRREVPQIH